MCAEGYRRVTVVKVFVVLLAAIILVGVRCLSRVAQVRVDLPVVYRYLSIRLWLWVTSSIYLFDRRTLLTKTRLRIRLAMGGRGIGIR